MSSLHSNQYGFSSTVLLRQNLQLLYDSIAFPNCPLCSRIHESSFMYVNTECLENLRTSCFIVKQHIVRQNWHIHVVETALLNWNLCVIIRRSMAPVLYHDMPIVSGITAFRAYYIRISGVLCTKTASCSYVVRP